MNVTIEETISTENISIVETLQTNTVLVDETIEVITIDIDEINETVTVNISEAIENNLINIQEVIETVEIRLTETIEVVNVLIEEFVIKGVQGKDGTDATVTEVKVKEVLGITILSGINTGDQDLSVKVDNARVLTDVPLNALFTDTTYTNVSEFINDAGYITSETDSQILSILGRDLSISNGNSILLPSEDLTPYETIVNSDNKNNLKVDKLTGSSLIEDLSIVRLQDTSGVNTGDQDLTPYELKTNLFELYVNFIDVEPFLYTAPFTFKINSIVDADTTGYTILLNDLPYTIGATITQYDKIKITVLTVGFLTLNSESI